MWVIKSHHHQSPKSGSPRNQNTMEGYSR